ncbi:hypothetical protein GCM10010260_73290 [Streptomyces filipinensis]|uniref:Uncharacterized protein n=1 Tax=Streptomyces filipinensis TaxID=66887 RepID=A0A918MFR5_9ACTN|nr:hypothetical protein GCM10010260_73290 [Streptomyces filipinensis]
MVVPFGSAVERHSRTTYRPTATPEGSTHVDTAFTGTTSSFSGTASGKLAAVARGPPTGFCGGPWPDATDALASRQALDSGAAAKAVMLSQQDPMNSQPCA